MKTLVIAGGGTGGHVLAGIAIADEWKNIHGAQAKIQFVGASGGLEERLVPKHGYPLTLFQLGALNRVGLVRKLKTFFQIPLTLIQALFLIVKWRPQYVLGVGGYASGPIVLVAATIGRVFGIRTAILEQNSVAGLTNRILGKMVNRVFLALPSEKLPFSTTKSSVTGNPIRSQMKPMAFPSFQPFTLFIFGGSQGALGINSLIIDALPFIKSQDIQFIHQTGVKDLERVRKAYADHGITARVEPFIDQMERCYQQASLIICRAGSSTLAELAAVGRAAIFVPLPTAADNHQEINARVYVDRGAGWIMNQGKNTGRELADLILSLKQNPAPILDACGKTSQFYKPNAAKDLILHL